jgi:hypothetical protein
LSSPFPYAGLGQIRFRGFALRSALVPADHP